jgi:hypothetical protein
MYPRYAYLHGETSLGAPVCEGLVHVACFLEDLVQLHSTGSTIGEAEAQGGDAEQEGHEEEKDGILPVEELCRVLRVEEQIAQRTTAAQSRPSVSLGPRTAGPREQR